MNSYIESLVKISADAVRQNGRARVGSARRGA